MCTSSNVAIRIYEAHLNASNEFLLHVVRWLRHDCVLESECMVTRGRDGATEEQVVAKDA